MHTLPEALAPLAAFNQFVLYKLIPGANGKLNKIPVNPYTRAPYPKKSDWQKDPTQMSNFATASANLTQGYGIGFLLTPNDPFYFLDIDKCLNPDGLSWSPLAIELINSLPGAAVEVSSSGRGLHIIGTGTPPLNHTNRNEPLGLELYTEWRFIALTGTHASGSVLTNSTAPLAGVCAKYFPVKAPLDRSNWTSEPVPEWSGPADDESLIERMLSAKTAASVFGGKSNFQALWDGDEDELTRMYPDSDRTYDLSQADSALAQHLAYWTGNNCDRIFSLMWRSGLVRGKWEREDYLERTILRAVALQDKFHYEIDTSIVDKFGAGKIDAGSDAQREFAENIRAKVVSACDDQTATFLCQTQTSAKFWLDNQDKTPEQLVSMLKPIESVTRESSVNYNPEIVSGFQYLSATLQIEKFAGCVYVTDAHAIFTPRSGLLDSARFNAVYGGYVFQMDERGDKVTRKAWEAFTESQCVRFPKADTTIFKPDLGQGALVESDGLVSVNIYTPIETKRVAGDATPFINHVCKLLPDERDREILLSYMAAIVQYKGVKFQWAPLLQGAPGNGKTLFTRCVAFAIGSRYTHMPKASDLTNKFNFWLLNKIFIGVEDVFVTESRREVLEELKPMITNDVQEIQAKGGDQINSHICANFILNSNHKDAIRKTEDDRRFAVFYTQQQTAADIIRDGMGGDYFPNLYTWLNGDGYAIVNEFLNTYQIKDEFNPAKLCHRAPSTSSTSEAVEMGRGGIEQEILEAIEEGRPGFAGGWVSSVALERLLKDMRADRAIPQNKRRDMMIQLGYDWHPHLKDGRVNNPISMDENKKPRLYIKRGHLALNQTVPSEVSRMYQNAQTVTAQTGPTPQEAFS